MGNKEIKEKTDSSSLEISDKEEIQTADIDTSYSSQLEESPDKVKEVLKDLRTIRRLYTKYFLIDLGSELDLEEALLDPDRTKALLNLELKDIVSRIPSIDVLTDRIIEYLR